MPEETKPEPKTKETQSEPKTSCVNPAGHRFTNMRQKEDGSFVVRCLECDKVTTSEEGA